MVYVLSQSIRLFRMIDIFVSSGDAYFYQIMDEKKWLYKQNSFLVLFLRSVCFNKS